MSNILPQQAGLEVNGVIYRYTAVKDTADDMVVHVQNENALGDGYIFRSSDDWSGLPGNTIRKVVPVSNIDISYWGDGSIQIDGTGSVEDATVIYTYQYDPCFDPQSRADCPGYIAPVEYSVEEVSYSEQDYIQEDLDRKKVEQDEEDQKEADRKANIMRKKRENDERLEVLLGMVELNDLSKAQGVMHELLMATNSFSGSYYGGIPGGTYEEATKLVDSKLPDHKQGVRVNLATQILHQKMVNLQYEN